MGGCLTVIIQVILRSVLARIVEEIVKRITGDKLIAILAAILALFGIRIKRPGQ